MFQKPSHKYPTNFLHNNFSFKKCSLNSNKDPISFRGPKLWNGFLNTSDKQISFREKLNQNYLTQKMI